MARIVDYASLTQAIADWSHRTDLTAGASPFSDYFIQAAQEQIEGDIFDLNMGNGIALQEASYGPYPIVNGVAPVPTDYLAPKLIYVADGAGNEFTLNFRAAAWIYDRYSARDNGGIPAYIARDVWQNSFAAPQTFTTAAAQTAFTLASAPSSASLVLVSLDGITLYAGTDYTLSGSALTLLFSPQAGQTLAVNYLSTSSGTQQWSIAPSQTTFQLNSPAASVILVSLDGTLLNSGTDYSVAGGFITLNSSPQSGQTLTAYYAIGSVFIFGPSPDGSYSLAGTYYAKAPVLAVDNAITSNWMSASAPHMLLSSCMMQVAKWLKDTAMYQTWGGEYQARLKSLVDKDKAERMAASTLAIELG